MHQSHWFEDAVAAESGDAAPALEGDIRADACIVGGGFTGLWTAINLKKHEPSLDVVLLEANVCGSGASSRNAGFLVHLWPKFPDMEKAFGTEEALRIGRASATAVDEILALCGAHKIDIQHQPVGWLWGSTNDAQSGHWTSIIDSLERHQVHPFKYLGKAEMTERTGSHAYVDGVLDASVGSIQPGRLVRGLRRVALEAGVRIFEHSAMTRLERSRPPVVHTANGQVRAGKVVLALYAWTLGIRELRPSLVVLGTDAVATEPVPELIEEAGFANAPAINDSRIFVQFIRTSADGRVVFGKAGGALPFGANLGPGFEKPDRSVDQLRNEILGDAYPQFMKAPVARTWSGPIERTKSGLPLFGALPTCPDVFYGFGYSGNGVLPSVLGGRILASLVLGHNDEWSNSGLVRPLPYSFPPEPIRYIGGVMVRAAILRKDRLENENRPVDLVTRGLAAFAPGGFKPAS